MNTTKTTTPAWKHTAIAATAFLALAAATPLHAFTLEGTFNGTTRYVSKTGSNANGGTSWDDAKLTIQAAVNLCADGDTVIVDDGEYSDTTSWTSTVSGTTYSNPCVVKITKRIHLVSRNGKLKTHIVGQWANTATGVANDGTAHRCIYIDGPNNAVGTLIEGFTIRNGATAGSGSGNNAVDSGGGICGGASSAVTDKKWYVLDCDFVNCRAGIGAAISRGCIPIRCAFTGNRSVATTGHVFYRTSYAYNCVLAANGPASRTVSTSGGALFGEVQGATLVNCTFIDNTCYSFQPNKADANHVTPVYNCAFLGDGEALSYGSSGGKAYIYPTNCVQTASGTDIGGRIAKLGSAAGDYVGVSEFQHYYAADKGEWTFTTTGDLKDKGFNARSVAASFVPDEYLDTDFFGNPRNWASVDIGAIEAQGAAADPALGTIRLGTNVAVRAGSAIVSLPRGLVSSASDSTTTVRLAALRSGDKRFVVTGSSSYSRYPEDIDRSASFDLPASGSEALVTLADPAAVFYVDAVNGDDANDGLAPATAKKTLAATLPSAAYGSIVHAAPGDYDEGSQTYTAGTLLLDPQDGTHSPSRGWVRAGVLLVGDEGPDVTFITGTIDNSNGNGLGSGAVRCITAANASVVRGFTMRNGATFNTTGAERDENMGGLAIAISWRHGLSGTALFEDCVFSNGYARTAGLVAGGIYRRCRFSGGHSTSGANLSAYSRFEHCLLLNDAVQNNGIRHSGGMLSSTYLSPKGKGDKANVEFYGTQYNYGATFENSILATANLVGNAVTMQNVTNCLWVTGGGNATIDSATCANVTTVATVADALAMLDADYRPLAGSSLVDAGDKSLLAHLTGDATTDLGGGQRIYGGQIDIGAYEYDLRGDISGALGGRVSNVGAASQDATLGADVVVLPEGEISATVSANEATSLVVPVQVTGAGTLSIFLGNSELPAATVTAADGAQQPRLSFAAGDIAVRLVFDGAGSASIGRFAGADPFVLTIR